MSRARTPPTTMLWSPPGWTASMTHSTQATDPAIRGEPVAGPGLHSTPANLSAPLTAKARHSASWSRPRTLTQKAPEERIRDQEVESREAEKTTRGGSRESDPKDWQVNPTGSTAVRPTGAAGRGRRR